MHTAKVRACKESVLIADKGNAPKACPASSKVGKGSVILYIKTSIGVAVYDIFYVVNSPSGEKLIAKVPKPPKPGFIPGSVTLQQLDMTISGRGKHPYITAPATCTGHWLFALTIRNWFGAPSVTAHDRVACTP